MVQRLFLLLSLVALVVAVAPAGAATGATPSLPSTTVFSVPNLAGGGEEFVYRELARQKGVVAVEKDQDRGLIVVRHTPSFDEQQIVVLLNRLGYPAVVVVKSAARNGEAASGQSACVNCPATGDSACGASLSAWKRLYEKIFGAGSARP